MKEVKGYIKAPINSRRRYLDSFHIYPTPDALDVEWPLSPLGDNLLTHPNQGPGELAIFEVYERNGRRSYRPVKIRDGGEYRDVTLLDRLKRRKSLIISRISPSGNLSWG